MLRKPATVKKPVNVAIDSIVDIEGSDLLEGDDELVAAVSSILFESNHECLMLAVNRRYDLKKLATWTPANQ